MLTAVTTTRIFCNDQCPAHPPRKENKVMFASVRDCLAIGCRPCKRCRPMRIEADTDWLAPLLDLIETYTKEQRNIDEKALRTLGLTKQFLGRWFASHHQFTFDAYCRMRRLANELGTHFCDQRSTDTVGRKVLFSHLLSQKAPNLKQDDLNSLVLVNRLITPLGPMVVCATDQGICLLEFADRRMLETQVARVAKLLRAKFRVGVNAHTRQLAKELKAYFAGSRTQFDVPLVDQATDFQNAVWEKLKSIPLGRTSTYQQLATELEKPKAVRAVGRANGDNRISILIPCHRVVGSDGSLTGYGGGLDRKRWLLDHERQVTAS